MTHRPVVCFGEMLLRYSPHDGDDLENASAFAVHVAGAEANVAISLACLGQPSHMATILPTNALGERALATLKAYGVDSSACLRAPGRMATFYINAPRSGREGGFFYDRERSAFAQTALRLDWDSALEGAAWLHLSGITAALGGAAVRAMRKGVAAAHRLGVDISFDCNYRPLLWQGREDSAAPILFEFASAARLIFATEWDERLLADHVADRQGRAADTPEGGLISALPQAEWIASTSREHRGAMPMLGAELRRRTGSQSIAPEPIMPFVDRVGAGDAFAAGLLFGLSRGASDRQALAFAHRACIMKHAISGDFSTISASQIEAAGAPLT